MSKSVLVAMSGGIDSAVAAYLLKEKGYRVIGLHFNFFDTGFSGQDKNLTYIGNVLGIPVEFYDARDTFEKEVIQFFARQHLIGKTPSPCTICNPRVKWKLLLQLADDWGIDHIATGHYIRFRQENGLIRIYRGLDPGKDQSYYLWKLGQNILSRALCPLGNFTKKDVKQLAGKIKLDFLIKNKESTGLCFAGNRSYAELLTSSIEKDQLPGEGKVFNKEGKMIGKHKGYIYYTIGQKRDLVLESSDKLCVVHIDPAGNSLVVDTWQSLYKDCFEIEACNFPDGQDLVSSTSISAIVRGFGLNPGGSATISAVDNEKYRVKLENPAWAIARGQPVVFYSGNKLVGGGLAC